MAAPILRKSEPYGTALTLYLEPPTLDISLARFEELALQRLKVRVLTVVLAFPKLCFYRALLNHLF